MERRNMNAWEDEAVHSAVKATGRKRLVIAGFLTEATSRRRLRQLGLSALMTVTQTSELESKGNRDCSG
jgi:hypothetical protein